MDSVLVARLKAQHSQIASFQSLSGTPALSFGVFHQGQIIHTAHFGRKDCAEPDAPDDHSIYYAGSMLKILTVSLVAKLVHDGVLEWDVPVRKYLPCFERDDDIGRLATLRDLIANRTGLAVGAFYWPFRTSFLYSQWNYILVQIVIETVTGRPFSELIQETMILPLGLKNTTFGIPYGDNLVAAHAVRDNGTAAKIKTNPWTDESGITAGAGGKASLKDLLTIYINLLKSYNYQTRHNQDTTPGSPFVDLRTIFAPQVKARSSNTGTQHYCLGLYRTTLPGNLSIASWNLPIFGDNVPVFGETLAGTQIYHHTMSIPGYLGSMFLVPDSNSGVVVLTNATPKFDATDVTAQCLLGVLLREPRPHLLRMAEMAPKISQAIFQHMADTLEKGRAFVPPSLPPDSYTGVYRNSSETFFLHVMGLQQGLRITVQGNTRVAYDLEPYGGDTFYWPVNREKEFCDKAMWPHLLPDFHIIVFEVQEAVIHSLRWHHDPMDEPEVFRKDLTWSRL